MRTNMQGWMQRQTDRGGNREVRDRDRERDESQRGRDKDREKVNFNFNLKVTA